MMLRGHTGCCATVLSWLFGVDRVRVDVHAAGLQASHFLRATFAEGGMAPRGPRTSWATAKMQLHYGTCTLRIQQFN